MQDEAGFIAGGSGDGDFRIGDDSDDALSAAFGRDRPTLIEIPVEF